MASKHDLFKQLVATIQDRAMCLTCFLARTKKKCPFLFTQATKLKGPYNAKHTNNINGVLEKAKIGLRFVPANVYSDVLCPFCSEPCTVLMVMRTARQTPSQAALPRATEHTLKRKHDDDSDDEPPAKRVCVRTDAPGAAADEHVRRRLQAMLADMIPKDHTLDLRASLILCTLRLEPEMLPAVLRHWPEHADMCAEVYEFVRMFRAPQDKDVTTMLETVLTEHLLQLTEDDHALRQLALGFIASNTMMRGGEDLLRTVLRAVHGEDTSGDKLNLRFANRRLCFGSVHREIDLDGCVFMNCVVDLTDRVKAKGAIFVHCTIVPHDVDLAESTQIGCTVLQ